MSIEKKIEIFRKLNIDKLIILEFNNSFMKTNAETFMNNILVEYFNPKYIVAGSNHHFGYKQSGDQKFLKSYCRNNKGPENTTVSTVKESRKDRDVKNWPFFKI